MSESGATSWGELLGTLGPTDWVAAQAEAVAREERRRRWRRFSVAALLLGSTLIVVLAGSADAPQPLFDGEVSDDPARLAVALSDDALWVGPDASEAQRALAPLALLALAQHGELSPGHAWDADLRAAAARLLLRPQASGPQLGLVAWVETCALLAAGRRLHDAELSAVGHARRAALEARPARRPEASGAAWRALAGALAERRPAPHEWATALGGPSGGHPVWAAAARLLLRGG